MDDRKTGKIAIIDCGNRTRKTLAEVVKNDMSVEVHDSVEKLKSYDFNQFFKTFH